MKKKKHSKLSVFCVVLIGFVFALGIILEIFVGDSNIEKVSVSVGQTFSLGEAEMKVNKVYFSDYMLEDLGRAEDGYRWVVVNATVHNPTSHKLTTSVERAWGTSVVYDNKYSYNSTFKNYRNFLATMKELIPLGSTTGIYTFKVPAEVERSNKPLSFVVENGSKRVTVEIRK